jgi:hypothetical protein
MRKQKHVTFKVWIEIERFDEKTDSGTTMDAPGSSLATFKTYKEAWDFAERVTDFAVNINH